MLWCVWRFLAFERARCEHDAHEDAEPEENPDLNSQVHRDTRNQAPTVDSGEQGRRGKVLLADRIARPIRDIPNGQIGQSEVRATVGGLESRNRHIHSVVVGQRWPVIDGHDNAVGLPQQGISPAASALA